MNCQDRIHFINGEAVPIKEEAVYLGGIINKQADTHKEVRRRIGIAMATSQKLEQFWKSMNCTGKWKAQVFISVIITQLTYGLETVPTTVGDERKLDAFVTKGVRKILGIHHSWISRISNERVWDILNEGRTGKAIYQNVSVKLAQRRARLLGHIIRAQEHDPMRHYTINDHLDRPTLRAKLRVGRPRQKWLEQAKQEAVEILINKEVFNRGQYHFHDMPSLNTALAAAALERHY